MVTDLACTTSTSGNDGDDTQAYDRIMNVTPDPIVQGSDAPKSARSSASMSPRVKKGPSGTELLEVLANQPAAATPRYGINEATSRSSPQYSPSTQVQKVGELPGKMKNGSPRYTGGGPPALPPRTPPKDICEGSSGSPPRMPPASTPNSGSRMDRESPIPTPDGDRIGKALSNYRHLSKEEKRRLLNEVKMVLGEESLMNDPSSGRDSHRDQRSGRGTSAAEGGESLLEMSHTHSEDSLNEDTAFYTEADDTAFYTEADDTAFYTEADDTAFYTEGDTAFYTEYTEGDTAFYTEGDTAFYTEYTEAPTLDTYDEDVEDSNYRRHRSARSSRRRADDYIPTEMDEYEEDDDNIFGLANVCISSMTFGCCGNDPKDVARKVRRRGRRDYRKDDDYREETDWNKGSTKYDRRESRERSRPEKADAALEDTMDATVESATAANDKSSARSARSQTSGNANANNGLTVKERLAQLENELITGKGGSSCKDQANVNCNEYEEGLMEKLSTLQERRVSKDSSTGVKEQHVPDVADQSGFWEGDGVWNADPSVAPSFMPNAAVALVAETSENDGGAEIPSTKSNSAENSVASPNRSREGSPAPTESKSIDGDDKNEAVADGGYPAPEDEDAKPLKQRSASPFVRAKTFTKRLPPMPRESPFVRALSSLSRKHSKLEVNGSSSAQQHDATKPQDSGSECSAKTDSVTTEPSDGAKSTKLFEAEGSASTDVSSGSPIIKQKGWTEYTDLATGNKYYSNGKMSTWERPSNAEIIVASDCIGPNSRNNLPQLPSSGAVPPEDQAPPSTSGSKESKGKDKKSRRFKLFFKGKKRNGEGAGDVAKKVDEEKGRAGPASPERAEATAASIGHQSPSRVNTPLADIVTESLIIKDGSKPFEPKPSAPVVGESPDTPKKRKKKRGWREYTDESGKKYYSDGVTTTWTKPDGFVGNSSTLAGPATATNSDCSRSKSLLQVSEHSVTTEKAKNRKKTWRATQDPNTGKTYYYNKKTKEVSWSMPVGFE